MAVIAKLFEDAAASRRDGDRRAVTLGATIRHPESGPLDGIVHDLSPNGFMIQMGRRLPIGAIVRIGLSGIGTSTARVMWRRDGMFGCAFVAPISAADVETALHADTVTQVAFPGAPVARDAAISARRNGMVGMLTVFGLSALLWAAAAGIVAFA